MGENSELAGRQDHPTDDDEAEPEIGLITAPPIVLGPAHYSGRYRLQMDKAGDLQQIVVFIDQQGSVMMINQSEYYGFQLSLTHQLNSLPSR